MSDSLEELVRKNIQDVVLAAESEDGQRTQGPTGTPCQHRLVRFHWPLLEFSDVTINIMIHQQNMCVQPQVGLGRHCRTPAPGNEQKVLPSRPAGKNGEVVTQTPEFSTQS